MRKGTVTWVDSENKFGFIGKSIPNGIHFHRDFQVFPQINDQGNLIFVPVNKKAKNVRQIQIGDTLLYEIEQKAKGPVASYWLFESQYKKIMLSKEEDSIIYRVIKKSKNTLEEVWQGDSLTDFFEKNVMMKFTRPFSLKSIFNKESYRLELKRNKDKEWREYENKNINKSIT